MKPGELPDIVRGIRSGAGSGWRLIAGTLLVATMAGCLGRSPEAEHFILGAPDGSALRGEPSDVALLVGPVRLPSYLDRPQFARLESGGSVEIEEYARWLGGFEENFLRGLSVELARLLGSDRIVTAPSKAPFDFDAQIRLYVDDMVVVPGRALQVRIRWAILPSGDRGEPVTSVMEETLPLTDDSNVAIVAAHEAALRDLAMRIAEMTPR